MPSAANASATVLLASGSSGPRIRSPASSSVTWTPKRAQPLGELGADRSAADDDQARGQLLGVAQHLAVGPERRVRQPVDGRRHRVGAGVEQDPLAGGVGGAVDLDGAWAGQRRVSAHEGHTRLDEPVDRDLVVPAGGGLVADPGVHRRPVGLDGAGPGEVGDPAGLGDHPCGTDDHLAGDAAVVRALAADEVPVHPDHVEPGLRELRRRRLSSRAQSHHDNVDLVSAHAGQPVTAAQPPGR